MANDRIRRKGDSSSAMEYAAISKDEIGDISKVHPIPVHNRDTVFDGRSNSNQTGTIMQTVFIEKECLERF